MHLIASHGLVHVLVPQVVSNFIFFYDGRDFISPVPELRFRDLRDEGRAIASENGGKKVIECLSLYHVSCHQVPCLIYWGQYNFFCLSFLMNVPVEAALILHIPCQIQLWLCLSFPDSSYASRQPPYVLPRVCIPAS